FRWERRGRGRRGAQRGCAVRTIDIIDANHALALRTVRTQFVTAARAEVESGLDGIPTLQAGAAARLPPEEVKNDAQSVGNNNGHNRPKRRAHPASFRVAIYIADEQQKAGPTNTGQQSKQWSCPGPPPARMPGRDDVEENLRGDEYDPREHPRPQRDNF